MGFVVTGNFEFGSAIRVNNVNTDSPGTWELVVWDNSSGLYPTWTQAYQAWVQDDIVAAESGRFNATFGGTGSPPNLVGLQSFNLYYLIPEPSCFALSGLGLAALLVFRRRK